MSVRDEILERLERLPDVPTYADAFDQLRPLYNRDVAPIIAQYGEPPRPQGQWRRDITGEAEGEEQKFVRTSKCELLDVMFLLPADSRLAAIARKTGIVVRINLNCCDLHIAGRNQSFWGASYLGHS
jgi:hypothetical protein